MNTRFAVAVHILTFLESQDGEPASSDLLAASVGTNASLIRRLLGQLSKAGLTRAQMGSGGGALLARAGERITLLDVYRVVDDEGAVLAIHPQPSPHCPVGRNIAAALEHRISAAERALQAELSTTTISDLASDVSGRESRRTG